MTEFTLMVPYRGNRFYFDVCLLPGLTWPDTRHQWLQGQCLVFGKDGDVPFYGFDLEITWPVFWLFSDALWHRLVAVAKQEAIQRIYQVLAREWIDSRRNREPSERRAEIRAQRGKIFERRFSILRIEKNGRTLVVYTRNGPLTELQREGRPLRVKVPSVRLDRCPLPSPPMLSPSLLFPLSKRGKAAD